jgi:hypothetical protein
MFSLIHFLDIGKPRVLSYYVITLIHYKPKSRMTGWIYLWVLQLKNTGDAKFNNTQAIDVWTLLFPVDPPFSTKLSFTKLIVSP